MTLDTLKKNLRKKGLDARDCTVCNLKDGRATAPAIMVHHDSEGLYPTNEAYHAYCIASDYARKHGFYAEERGFTQATLIY